MKTAMRGRPIPRRRSRRVLSRDWNIGLVEDLQDRIFTREFLLAAAIQELAGHQDLGTTQRYMHPSPAALDATIRLLETGTEIVRVAVEK